MAENDQLAGTLVANPTDPSVVQGLLADPRFQKLNSAQKRQLLSEADPVFADPQTFNDAAIEQFAATKPHQQSVDEAMARGLQKNKGAGKFPEVAPISAGRRAAQFFLPALAVQDAISGKDPAAEALSQGGLETILAGTPEAIAARSGVNVNEPNSPKYLYPKTYAAGETLGALLPLGEFGKATSATKQTLSQLIKQGMRIGGIYGAGSGVASEAKKEDPTLSGALTRGVTGGAFGTAIGGLIPIGVKGLVNLPQTVAKFAKGKIDKINEEITKTVEAANAAEAKKPAYEEKLSNDIQQILDEKSKSVDEMGKELEKANATQFLSQEELAKLEQEAKNTATQSRFITAEKQPQIEQRLTAIEEANKLQKGISESLPQVPEPSQLSESTIGGIQRELSAEQKRVGEAYKAVKTALPEKEPTFNAPSIETSLSEAKSEGKDFGLPDDVVKFIDKISEKTKESVSPEIQKNYTDAVQSGKDKYVKLLESEYPELKGGNGYTWTGLQKLYSKLNEKIGDAFSKNDRQAIRVYGGIKRAVKQDMQAYADQVGGDVKVLFDKANASNVAKEEKFGNPIIEPLLKEKALTSPEEVVNRIIGEKNVSTINNLKKILSPEEFSLIQSTYADKLFSPEKGVPFDPNHFVNQFNNHSDETLKSVFGEEGYRALKNLYDSHRGTVIINEMQQSIAEANAAAQKAQDAYLNATSTADKKAIFASIEEKYAPILNAWDKKIEEAKAIRFDQKTADRFAAIEKEIKETRAAMEKAQNPIAIPKLVKLTTLVAAVGSFYYHHNVAGTLFSVSTILGSDKFSKSFTNPAALSALERAANPTLNQAQSEAASLELAKILIKEKSTTNKRKKLTPREQKMADSIQKSIDEAAAKTVE